MMADKKAPTPGPWTFEMPDSLGVTEIVRPVEDGEWEYIATMGTTHDNWEANAKLICAAPDLLAGAKDLFEKLPEAAMLGARLRLAISKAEGK